MKNLFPLAVYCFILGLGLAIAIGGIARGSPILMLAGSVGVVVGAVEFMALGGGHR